MDGWVWVEGKGEWVGGRACRRESGKVSRQWEGQWGAGGVGRAGTAGGLVGMARVGGLKVAGGVGDRASGREEAGGGVVVGQV